MSIEAATYTFLTGESGITDIVGSRIYPCHLPQNPVFPALVFTLISGTHDQTLVTAAGLLRARIQFDAYSRNLSEVSEIIEQLRLALDRFVGSYGERIVIACKVDNETTEAIAPTDGGQLYLFRKSADYLLRIRE